MTPHGPNDLMNGYQQMRLSQKLGETLDQFRLANGLSAYAILYFLVAYVWGYARACGWSTRQLKGYQDRAWDACERQEKPATDDGNRIVVP